MTRVKALLSMVAAARKAPAAAHNQALSAVLRLYREVRHIGLPLLNRIERQTHSKRMPSVLTSYEMLVFALKWSAWPRCWQSCGTPRECA